MSNETTGATVDTNAAEQAYVADTVELARVKALQAAAEKKFEALLAIAENARRYTGVVGQPFKFELHGKNVACNAANVFGLLADTVGCATAAGWPLDMESVGTAVVLIAMYVSDNAERSAKDAIASAIDKHEYATKVRDIHQGYAAGLAARLGK